MLNEQNRAAYLKYAVGEVLLVVIGILIALQVNNWNEERIEQRQIREFVLSLVGDIERDMEMLIPVAQQIQNQIDQSEMLAAYMQGRALEEIRNIDLYMYTRQTSYRPYGWNRASMEQLKSSGALRQIKNLQLVKAISEYDALTRHLDQDYDNDENKGREAAKAANQIVDLNYANRTEIDEHLDTGITPAIEYSVAEVDNAFRESESYRQIRENDLQLLTSDIKTIRQATNIFMEIGDNLEARTEIEIPRLRQFGQNIIDLVSTEYGQ